MDREAWWATVHGVAKESDMTELAPTHPRLPSLLHSRRLAESGLLWQFLAVYGFVQVSCQDFLVREACVRVLLRGAVFLLSGVQ